MDKRYLIYVEDYKENIISPIYKTNNPSSLISKIVIFIFRCVPKYETVIEDTYITKRKNNGS